MSYRDGDPALVVGLQAIPLSQDVEGGYGAGQASLEPIPNSMAHFLGVPHHRHHGEDGFHNYQHIPLTTTKDPDVGWVAISPVKAGVGQDDHLTVIAGEWLLYGREPQQGTSPRRRLPLPGVGSVLSPVECLPAKGCSTWHSTSLM